MFIVILCVSIPSIHVSGVKPIILSKHDTPPTIDGAFPSGEWTNHQLYFEQGVDVGGYLSLEAYVYFVNDNTYLYIMVDAIGDTSDDDYDECLFWFHNGGTERHLSIVRKDGLIHSNDFYAVIGFGISPNSAQDHRMYEWRIPLDYINVVSGGSVDMCSPHWKDVASMGYDETTGYDNVWPEGVDDTNYDTWGILQLATKPVGGELFFTIVQNMSIMACLIAPFVVLVALKKRL